MLSFTDMGYFTDKSRNTIILFSLLIIGSFYLLYHCFYTAFWYDEAYTINLVRHSFSQLWYITANDVHPPLYYALLKVYTYFAGQSVVALRIFSYLPVIGCLIIGCTLIRKDFGDKTAVLFLSIFILLPVTQYIASEIRMYSLAMLFVLGSAIYSYRSFNNFSKFNLIKLTLFSLAAAYTHYYALMAVFYIYAILFTVLFIYKRDKSLQFLGIGILFIVGYLPWLIHIPAQMGQVSDEYWINQSRLKDLVIYIYYPFSTELDLVGTGTPLKTFAIELTLTAILLSIVCYTVVDSSRGSHKEPPPKSIFGKLIFAVFILVISSVIVYSFAVKPVFVTRYMNPLMALFILFIAIHLSLLNYDKTINKVIVSLFFVILGFLSVNRFILQKETNDRDQWVQNNIIHFAEQRVDSNTVFLYSDTRSFAIAFGNLLYPDHKHYQRIRLTKKYYKQYLKNFNCIPIFDFKEVEPSYKNALIIKNVDKDDSFMNVTADSIEVSQYFEIVDRADFKGHVVYQLRRKE
ncbi:hypothetical protein E2605_16910 [Dysgonomonas capnocytophagoides]|uniref:Glycosyltransferase RgtA/B/C/D-like domain-containing protein n=1 Tax=Dysgonomonas capnocytophagoides TaxID=45254 RepID=A0A4Y8KUU5_9BACT|nr:hypothetical protein [Dysgonomonas capnocytophagoides]TFD93162.1 hypothetical protein E2605_16910 [Dysgonomonas capnocytophagoides]